MKLKANSSITKADKTIIKFNKTRKLIQIFSHNPLFEYIFLPNSTFILKLEP